MSELLKIKDLTNLDLNTAVCLKGTVISIATETEAASDAPMQITIQVISYFFICYFFF